MHRSCDDQLGRGLARTRGNRRVLGDFPNLLRQVDSAHEGEDLAGVSAGSNRQIWWRCPQGIDHVWKAVIVSRTGRGDGCPFCSNKRVSITNSLASVRSDLAAEWDITNNDLVPSQIVFGSTYPATWRCPVGADHVWQVPVRQRTGTGTRPGSGCPFCAGRRVSVTNSLSSRDTGLAEEFDTDLNDGLTSDQVLAGSNTAYWWRCDQGPDHVWKATPSNRFRGRGCPCCAGRKISITNCLATRYPDIAAQLDPRLNDGISGFDVLPGSHVKLIWRCPVNQYHTWPAQVYNRTIGRRGCPYCARKRPTVGTSLAATYPQITAQLDESASGVRAVDLLPSSNRRVTWICDNGPDHVWQATVADRTAGDGCPACGGRQLSVTNSLARLYPEVADQLDVERCGLTPDKVLAGTDLRLPWICSRGPDHRWEARVVKRTKAGRGCPYCAGRRVSSTNSLATMDPEIAGEYDTTRNQLTVNQVISGSNTPVWWRCPAGPDHTWCTSPANRTRRGSNCPCCANKQLSVTNCLASLHPELGSQLATDRNEGLTANQIISGSHLKVWWRCPVEPAHIWQAMVSNRTRLGVGCPYCCAKISKPQLILAAELTWVFAETDLAVDEPSFRVGRNDPDIHINGPSLAKRGITGVAVLYDGSYWHKGKEHADRQATTRLQESGRLVLRVRENPLESLGGNDVLPPANASIKAITDIVINALVDSTGPFRLPVGRVSDYLTDPDLQAVDLAEELLVRYWKPTPNTT